MVINYSFYIRQLLSCVKRIFKKKYYDMLYIRYNHIVAYYNHNCNDSTKLLKLVFVW